MAVLNQFSPSELSNSNFRVDESLPKAMGPIDMCRAFGWSEPTFYRKQREGDLKPFLLPRALCTRLRKYSGAKVQEFLNGRSK